jgi:hypothetical protein
MFVKHVFVFVFVFVFVKHVFVKHAFVKHVVGRTGAMVCIVRGGTTDGTDSALEVCVTGGNNTR